MHKQIPPADFQQVQRQLAAHLRDPEHHAPPEGLEERRLAIYQRLFFNNILGFISHGLPVLKSLYKESDWHSLVRSFYSRHRCHSPCFTDITKEFINYLEKEHIPRPCDPPYLYELAHYERIEFIVSAAKDADTHTAIDPKGDLMSGRPVLSSSALWYGYQWPVHRISPNYRPTESGPDTYWIVIYRDTTYNVRYMLLNPVTVLLLDYLSSHSNSKGHDAILAVAQQHCPQRVKEALDSGHRLLENLRSKDLILGTKIEHSGASTENCDSLAKPPLRYP